MKSIKFFDCIILVVMKRNLIRNISKLLCFQLAYIKNITVQPSALFMNTELYDALFCDAAVAGSTIIS
jgi:hypothetical protein